MLINTDQVINVLYIMTGMSKLIHKGTVWLQYFVPTSQEHTVWPINFLKTEISWLNESGQACCCLVEKAICGIVWTCLYYELKQAEILNKEEHPETAAFSSVSWNL